MHAGLLNKRLDVVKNFKLLMALTGKQGEITRQKTAGKRGITKGERVTSASRTEG